MNHHSFKITLNFLAVILLISLIAVPFYFARNFAKVAGVKSESKYLLVSQIEKFPGMSLSQQGDQYTISFTKLGPSQAYLGVLILNNPTDKTQTYSLERLNLTGGSTSTVFFGENLSDQKIKITLPANSSVPLSLLSDTVSETESQTVEFKINVQ